MKINVFCITKNDSYAPLYKEFQKQCKSFGASLQIFDLFPSEVAKAQKSSPRNAQNSYTQAFQNYITPHSYALHPKEKILDSFGFAKLFEMNKELNFFIGGAYGFNQSFLNQVKPISLSPLTFSHQIAKLVLCEQIYRALSINASHPYHK